MDGKLTTIYLFNCDNTCSLDPVETFLLKMENDLKMRISVGKRYFRLQQMSEMCETVIPALQMDCAIFVVHAHESRLSINEDNAGIGYARLYRALLQATGGKVLIVIGGDDSYTDEDEKERSVISRWARRKVSSQFDDEYLDGRKSFIFSWNKIQREIHEKALLHYFDPSKTGKKFEYQPKRKPTPVIPREIPKEFPVKEENGTRLRKLNDQDLKIDLEEPSFGGMDSAPPYYPEGTVLLDTRIRYGSISYKDDDLKIWDRRWQPSERAVQDLLRDWKTISVANVQFISNGYGGVFYNVFKVQPRGGEGWYSWVTICTGACLLVLIFFGIWRFLDSSKVEPNVDQDALDQGTT